MRILLIIILVSFSWAIDFDSYFTGQTFRFDFFHNGTATEEHISFDQIRSEGPWPGSRTQLIYDTNLGKYYIEVIDLSSAEIIYSRGFCSIYGEWETTSDARSGNWGTFHESLRFPEPKSIVKLQLYKRNAEMRFIEIFGYKINPADFRIKRSKPEKRYKTHNIMINGDPATKVDILLLGDGYTRIDAGKFKSDTRRMLKALFATEPFKSRKEDFNVRSIKVHSPEAGISNPRKNIWKNNTLGTSYNTFDSDRYVLTFDNQTIREIAAQAPYDILVILINDDKYGGGGIFNLYATVAVDTEPAEYVMVHELGHAFGGLGDEYYSSNVAYENFNPQGVEPWDPNVTALLEPDQVKWGNLVEPGTPLPTPWNKAAFDSARVNYSFDDFKLSLTGTTRADTINARFRAIKKSTEPVLQANEYFGKVGAFEGAGYEVEGLYRPEIDCIMFSRNPDYFCRVCQAAIVRMIDFYTK